MDDYMTARDIERYRSNGERVRRELRVRDAKNMIIGAMIGVLILCGFVGWVEVVGMAHHQLLNIGELAA